MRGGIKCNIKVIAVTGPYLPDYLWGKGVNSTEANLTESEHQPPLRKNLLQSHVKIKRWTGRAAPAWDGNCPATCNISC